MLPREREITLKLRGRITDARCLLRKFEISNYEISNTEKFLESFFFFSKLRRKKKKQSMLFMTRLPYFASQSNEQRG